VSGGVPGIESTYLPPDCEHGACLQPNVMFIYPAADSRRELRIEGWFCSRSEFVMVKLRVKLQKEKV